MYNYQLNIKLTDGKSILGKAQTTHITDKKEYLVIEEKGKTQSIRLDKIQRITALDKVTKFETVEIS